METPSGVILLSRKSIAARYAFVVALPCTPVKLKGSTR